MYYIVRLILLCHLVRNNLTEHLSKLNDAGKFSVANEIMACIEFSFVYLYYLIAPPIYQEQAQYYPSGVNTIQLGLQIQSSIEQDPYSGLTQVTSDDESVSHTKIMPARQCDQEKEQNGYLKLMRRQNSGKEFQETELQYGRKVKCEAKLLKQKAKCLQQHQMQQQDRKEMINRPTQQCKQQLHMMHDVKPDSNTVKVRKKNPQAEILLNIQAERYMQETKMKGLTLILRHAKVMLCGHSKAGNTGFSCLLRNDPLDEKYRSTLFGETQQIIVSRKVHVIGTDWKNLDIKLEMQKVISLLVAKLEQKKLSAVSHDHPVSVSLDDIEHHVEPVVVEKEMTLLEDSSESNSEVWDLLTLLDAGGQPEFVNMLPAINASTAITFLVVDLSGGVDCFDKPVVAQNSDTRYKFNTKNYTNLHLLECLLSSVKESAKKQPYYPTITKIKEDQCLDPAVCVIGTHSDVLKESLDTVVEVVDKQITKCIKSIDTDEAINVWNYNGRNLIPVNNTIAGNNQMTDSIAEKIRSRIKEILEKAQYEIPITWIILELQLRCEGKAIISLNDVKILCDRIIPKEHQLEEWQLVKALEFYRSIGVMLYFDEEESGMNDVVITDPQWLFSNLTKLVTCAFIRENFVDYRTLNKFVNKGIFNAKLLQDINLDIQSIRKESFLQLLVYLKIVASIDDKDQEYFIPCVLPTCTGNIEEQLCVYGEQVLYKCNGEKNVKVKPLLITFNFGTIPRGFFCFVIVQLMQNNTNWKLYGTNDYDFVYRYDNLITFRIKKYHYLLVIDRVSHMELQVRVKNQKPSSSVHYKVQNAVTDALIITSQKFGWHYNDLRYGFICHECLDHNHLTLLSRHQPFPSGFPTNADCGEQATKLTEEHKVWFLNPQV